MHDATTVLLQHLSDVGTNRLPLVHMLFSTMCALDTGKKRIIFFKLTRRKAAMVRTLITKPVNVGFAIVLVNRWLTCENLLFIQAPSIRYVCVTSLSCGITFACGNQNQRWMWSQSSESVGLTS